MDIGLHCLLVQQVGHKDDNLWTVRAIDEMSFDDISAAIGAEGITSEEVEGVIANVCVLEELCDYVDREYANQVCQQYADNHLITLSVTVPYM